MVKRLNLNFESIEFEALKEKKLQSNAPNWEEFILRLAGVKK